VKRKIQNIHRSYFPPIWLLLCVLVKTCLLVAYFFSGIVKWVIVFLSITANAGLGVRKGIKGGFLLVIGVGTISFVVLWVLESPEYWFIKLARKDRRGHENITGVAP
jgi:cytochrome c oxidase subunit IV